MDVDFARNFLGRYLAAWNARQPEGLLALAHPHVRWDDPSIPGGVAQGHDAVRTWLVGFWTAFPDMTFAHLDGQDSAAISLDGQTLVAPWTCTGTWLGVMDPPGLAPNGGTVNLVGCDLYRFEGELLVSVRTLTDLVEAGRQLGIVPRPGGMRERALAAAQRWTSPKIG